MATFNKTDSSSYRAATDCNLNTDSFKYVLTNTAPTANTSVLTDITEISPSANYPSGGVSVSTSFTETSGVSNLTAGGNVVITPDTGEIIGPFQYVALIDSTPADGPVISYWARNSAVTLDGDNNDTFTISPDGPLFTIGG